MSTFWRTYVKFYDDFLLKTKRIDRMRIAV
jgi:hypothetical protein